MDNNGTGVFNFEASKKQLFRSASGSKSLYPEILKIQKQRKVSVDQVYEALIEEGKL